MQIRDLTGSDFEPLSRIVGELWHAHHEGRSYWYGADELCVHLSLTDKGFVAESDGKVIGAILLQSPREEDKNKDLYMHWIQQRTRIAAMCNVLGFNAREDNEVLNVERDALSLAADQYGNDNVGEVVLFVVAKAAQGQGVGHALMQEGVTWLANHDARVVRLVTADDCDWQVYEHYGMERLPLNRQFIFDSIESYVYQADAADLLARLEDSSDTLGQAAETLDKNVKVLESDSSHTALVDELLVRHAQDAGVQTITYNYHVEKDGRMVAGVSAWSMGPDVHVDMLAVDEAERGQGFGSLLLAHVEQAARQNGCTTASVDTFSFQAPNYYPAHGYEVVFRYALDDGSERIYFSKRL
jgi:GNAT superfamily N-acetyltransferase